MVNMVNVTPLRGRQDYKTSDYTNSIVHKKCDLITKKFYNRNQVYEYNRCRCSQDSNS